VKLSRGDREICAPIYLLKAGSSLESLMISLTILERRKELFRWSLPYGLRKVPESSFRQGRLGMRTVPSSESYEVRTSGVKDRMKFDVRSEVILLRR
jgi:hypothetical protein